jgi:hypothetical protein
MVQGKHDWIIILFGVIFLLNSGCSKKKNETGVINMDAKYQIEWNKLTEKKIFFGHQSVGNNIIQGIEVLKGNDSLNNFSIQNITGNLERKNGILMHANIGRNTDPKSKIDDFARYIREELKDSVDIALMKFCYVDFSNTTDIEELFGYYKKTVTMLQTEYPSIRFLHCTAPVMTYSNNGLKRLAKRILKKDNNVFINRYNSLVRKNFSSEIIFDLAKVESTYTNGKVNEYSSGVQALIEHYTSDGGHLNTLGQKMVSIEFIKFLEGIHIQNN